MRTLQDAVRTMEERLFVGRERETETFLLWLGSAGTVPQFLNVFGPGGVGKTALLNAFRRIASHQGWPVVMAGGGNFLPTPEGLLQSLAGPDVKNAIGHLNQVQPLIMLDAFEELVELVGYLEDEFLPSLDAGVRLLIAGRHPLHTVWSSGAPWHKLVRPLSLGSLTAQESRDYLSRRGLSDPTLVRAVLTAAGGHPLSLSLATDMVLQFRVLDLTRAPAWRLVTHSLAEEFIKEVADPELRIVLQACAVLRQFDEATLAAVSGAGIGKAFDLLCRLSVVRPSDHGLMLHEDVRRILGQDLRWRLPERYQELRVRAHSYYRTRARSAPPEERGWLLSERFFLWENDLIHRFFFAEGDAGEVLVTVGREEDREAILEVEDVWKGHVAPGLGATEYGRPYDEAADRAWLEGLLRFPGLRVRVARDRHGQEIGFSIAIPVCRETLDPLTRNPILEPVLRAYMTQEVLSALPSKPEDTRTLFLLRPRSIGEQRETAQAMLMRDVFGLLAGGGVYLTASAIVREKALLETLGFNRLPSEKTWMCFTQEPWEGFVLDLLSGNVETWLEAIMDGRRPPRVLPREELERELQVALGHWQDDDWLAASTLSEMVAIPSDELDRSGAQEVRDMINRALDQARSKAEPDQRLAYRALDLAYFQKRVSHEGAAERLAVSRSTFYRLLKRGVQGLARALVTPERSI
jgi:hypothetical protein